MDQQPHLIKNQADTKSKRVEQAVVPGSEEEAIEVEHLLAEPKSDHVSVDGFLCFDKENSEKHLKVDGFGYDYGWKINCGMDCDIQGGADIKFEALDGWLDEVDEVDDIQAGQTLSGAYEDFLLDVELPEKFSELDYGCCDGSHIGNSSTESHSPVFSGSSNSTSGISESPIATVQESDCKNGLPGKNGCGYEATATNEIHPTTEDLQNLNESDDDEKPLVSLILSKKKAKVSTKLTKGGMLCRQMRLRKPTVRYIDESSRLSSTAPRSKRLKVQHDNELPEVLSESRLLRGRVKKVVPKSELQSDDDLTASDYEDDKKKTKRSKMSSDRRKHQRMWTLEEVVKLVDGISQYGVGKWTAIKRLLFSSSVYRTPIDLRDKWRNLVRSSCGHKRNNKEVERNLKHTARPLPKTVVRRVRELATIYPYPNVCSPKIEHVTPTKHPARAKVAQLCPRGKNVSRKNGT
ncbi:hypothetical protein SLEP1_g55251 [Rubroshorea leprosula]|uniref:Uncharacterized protein n=1 Tax=Rubroshorea leprosula TaxID=152421 RepID=A0AAV5MG12_9ROSI|nr:hypothetical protein SLEP1_g55251 [Rubroshorea leprosula]